VKRKIKTMMDQICIPIKNELGAVEEIISNQTVSSVPLASEVVHYTIGNGGKRVRPALFLLAARLVGARGNSLASIAAGIECLHTASLLHDDVVDEAHMRRGRRAARLRWGNQISVLTGDFLWCCATSLILEAGPPALFSVIAKAVMKTAEGELLEITKQNDPDCDQDTYIRIVKGKTAALFEACGSSAAIMAEASSQYRTALEGYSHNIGMAFQLMDDVLDYASTEALMGKSTGSDLREGRLTLPLIVASERADAVEKKQIRDIMLSPKPSEDEVLAVMNIVDKWDGVQATRSLAFEYVEQAKAHLAVFKPSIEREALLSLSDYILEREK